MFRSKLDQAIIRSYHTDCVNYDAVRLSRYSSCSFVASTEYNFLYHFRLSESVLKSYYRTTLKIDVQA